MVYFLWMTKQSSPWGKNTFLRPFGDVIRQQFIQAVTGVMKSSMKMNTKFVITFETRRIGSQERVLHSTNWAWHISKHDKKHRADTYRTETKEQGKTRSSSVFHDGGAEEIDEENSMTGVSNWLTALSIKELGYKLNKERFQDFVEVASTLQSRARREDLSRYVTMKLLIWHQSW